MTIVRGRRFRIPGSKISGLGMREHANTEDDKPGYTRGGNCHDKFARVHREVPADSQIADADPDAADNRS